VECHKWVEHKFMHGLALYAALGVTDHWFH